MKEYITVSLNHLGFPFAFTSKGGMKIVHIGFFNGEK